MTAERWATTPELPPVPEAPQYASPVELRDVLRSLGKELAAVGGAEKAPTPQLQNAAERLRELRETAGSRAPLRLEEVAPADLDALLAHGFRQRLEEDEQPVESIGYLAFAAVLGRDRRALGLSAEKEREFLAFGERKFAEAFGEQSAASDDSKGEALGVAAFLALAGIRSARGLPADQRRMIWNWFRARAWTDENLVQRVTEAVGLSLLGEPLRLPAAAWMAIERWEKSEYVGPADGSPGLPAYRPTTFLCGLGMSRLLGRQLAVQGEHWASIRRAFRSNPVSFASAGASMESVMGLAGLRLLSAREARVEPKGLLRGPRVVIDGQAIGES